MTHLERLTLGVVAAMALSMPHARAQTASTPTPGGTPAMGVSSSTMPLPLREIGFDQRLNQRVPFDVVFQDDEGRSARFGDYFGQKPVVLVFAYYTCPMLCPVVLGGLTSALRVLSFTPGKDFEVVAVSIDPHDTPAGAAATKADYLKRYARDGAADGWHFLTGEQASIDALAKAAGFRYVWDRETNQFAHPAGIIVLTPDGRLARYLFGIEYAPRDLRLALVDASAGVIGSPVDSLLLYCYHYDPMTGRYGLVIMRAVRLAGAATVLTLGTFITVMLRRERRASGGR